MFFCGSVLSFTTTTCHNTVAGGRHGHVSSKILLLQQGLFLCPWNVTEIIGLLQALGKSDHPFLGDITGLKTVCLSF